MTGLIQRVPEAAAHMDGHIVDEIGPGLLVLVCTGHGNTVAEVDRLLGKLLSYRVFSDAQGKMSLPVRDIDGNGQVGSLLVVSQFTLAADTKPGTRLSFAPATASEDRRRLYEHLVACTRIQYPIVAAGKFDADMKVSLANGGPVTFWLQIASRAVASATRTAAPEVAKSA